MSIISAIILDLDCLFQQRNDIPQIFYTIHFQCNTITSSDKFQPLSYQHFQLDCPTHSEKLEPWIDSNPSLLYLIASCCWRKCMGHDYLSPLFKSSMFLTIQRGTWDFHRTSQGPNPHQPPPLLTYHVTRKNSLSSMSYSTCPASCLSLPSYHCLPHCLFSEA